MQITDDHVEWAVVNRLQKMLEALPHPEFNVTETYALFVSILCWTIQRVRTKGTSETDVLAKDLWIRLQKQKAGEVPWSVAPDCAKPNEVSASEFLFELRNAVAHGDATNVRPMHRDLPG
ncbi:MAG: hypothetical protein ACRECO_10255, partial [Xanthobacteraceae bacterium]